MWNCKNCNAENEDNFDICWSCGSDKLGFKSIDKSQEELFVKTKEEATKFAIERTPSDFKKNRPYVLTVAAIMLVSFFIPWLKVFIASLSAWDLTFGEAGIQIESGLKYLALLLPLSSIMILYGTAFNEGKYFIVKPLLFALPLITLIAFAIVLHQNLPREQTFFNSVFDNIFRFFSIGFWTTLICSIILCYVGLTTNFGTSLALTETATTQPEANPIFKQEPTPLTSQPTSNQIDLVQQLERIQKMKESGHISEEEYQKMKTKIIAAFD